MMMKSSNSGTFNILRKKKHNSNISCMFLPRAISTLAAPLGLLLVFFALNDTILSSTYPSHHLLDLPSEPTTRTSRAVSITSSSISNHHQQQSAPSYTGYIPAESEAYILSHTRELQLDNKPPALVSTCQIWTDKSSTPYHKELMDYHTELKNYHKKIDNFQFGNKNIHDVRQHLHDNNNDICQQLELHSSGGLPGLFPSGQLSYSRSGFIEPLLPQMRHPDLCLQGVQQSTLFNLEYMIHDFQHMCQQLKPTSRIIFVDMGASLSFHFGRKSPALYLIDLYTKMGFPFDHIYAYEMRQQNAEQVINQLPKNLLASYHWINVGVDSNPTSKKNPFSMLLEHYNEDDLVVVKLDVDTPILERELADQLLANPKLLNLIDQFYFEHHVNQQELANNWGPSKESVDDTLTLFRQLREKGVGSHYWV